MDAGLRKHRITRWMGRAFVALSLVASSGAQAAVEYVPTVLTWCVSSFVYVADCMACGFSTDFAAAQKTAALATEGSARVHATYQTVLHEFTVTSCDGKGICDYCSTIKADANPSLVGSRTCTANKKLARTMPGCPIPTFNPTVPYKFDYTGKCYRILPDNLTITLYGGTEIEPSNGSDKKSLPIIATVLDQSTNKPPTNPVKVHVSLKVDPTSGGHDHGDSTRPRGGIAEVETCPSDDVCWPSPQSTDSIGMTDGNGQVVFNFNAPEASGTHTITATCDGCGSSSPPKTVEVKVNGLETIPSSSFYTFIGETDNHSDNHYLTQAAASILWRIAVSYQTEQQFKLRHPVTRKYTVTPPVLHVNDASLEWGGKFDLSGSWSGSHYEHKRGTVVDIRANDLDTAIPVVNFNKFQRLVKRYGALAILEEPDVNRRHFHLRLLNRKE